MRSVPALVLSLLCVAAVASGALAAPPAEPPGLEAVELVERIPGMGPDQGATVALVDGEVALLYLDGEQRVSFRRAGDRPVRLDEGPAVARPGGKHLWLYERPEGLFALWWRKQADGGKHLYLRRSADGGRTFEQAVKLNAAAGVLPTYGLASDGQGRVAVAYHDERAPRYRIFVNVSHDGGKTWLDEDIRVDTAGNGKAFAVEPQLVFAGGRLVLTWKDRGGDGDRTRLMARASDDGGLTWGQSRSLGEFQGFFTSDALVSGNGYLFLCGYVPDQGVTGYLSSDAGSSWQEIGALPGTAPPEVSSASQIRAVVLDKSVAIVFSMGLAGRDGYRRTFKPRVMSAVFDPVAGKWKGAPVRLDTGKPHDLTAALNGKIAVTSAGGLVAAWEDYRDIRPNIYVSHSSDGGRSWSASRPIGDPGQALLAFPRLEAEEEGGDVLLFFDRFGDDARSERAFEYAVLEVVEQGIANLPAFTEVPREAKEKRLRARAEAFWSLRKEGEHAKVFDYFDPGLRSRIERDSFAVSQRRLQYLDYEVKGAQIQGNIAGVLTKVRVEVKPTQIKGQEFEMEPREDLVPMEWVWVGDDWYAVYEGPAETRFLRY